MIEAARGYIARGWHVFPTHSVDDEGNCTCGKVPCKGAGKHPRTKNGLKDATTDPAQIEEWFGGDAPASNIAIRTGRISGITVIDVDAGSGKDGEETWANLHQGRKATPTLKALTGGGGFHDIFQYSPALKSAQNIHGKDIDCRNDGGYIIAAPSRHKSGASYAWMEEGAALAKLPEHLANPVKGRRQGKGATTDGADAKTKSKQRARVRREYSLGEVESMLALIPADNRDAWMNYGIALGRAFDRSEPAWTIYVGWADKWRGTKAANHDEVMHNAFHVLSQEQPEGAAVTIASIVSAAKELGWEPAGGVVSRDDFVFFGESNAFLYRPTRATWQSGAVDAVCEGVVVQTSDGPKTVPASSIIKVNNAATAMTSDPDQPEIIEGANFTDGELVSCRGARTVNVYRHARPPAGDSDKAGPFIDHTQRLMRQDGDACQFLNYMAHRVQRTGEKPRFALLVAGEQGTGKDTCVEFCIPAIGSWNVANIDPSAFDSDFTEYRKASLVRINETANHGDASKWAFNERTKVLIAGAPDIAEINPKYGRKYWARMHCGVILTTNSLAAGIYIPQDDRRYDVIECATLQQMGLGDEQERREYFQKLWHWFHNGGAGHVAAFLKTRDISRFSASEGQRKTAAHQSVASSGLTQDEWLDDYLASVGDPPAFRADRLVEHAAAHHSMTQNEVARQLSPAAARAGYRKFPNRAERSGRWRINGKRVAIYADVKRVGIGYDPTTDEFLK